MEAREEKGRQLVAELAEFLRAGNYPKEAHNHLDSIVRFMREIDFKAPIDGTGNIICDVSLFLSLTPTPDGLEVGPAS